MINPLIQQLFRFGIVGLTAAAFHYCVVILLVQNQVAVPLVANVFGFFCGFQVSYWGHRRWTFSHTQAPHRNAVPKMILVQSLNFVGNETLFYILLSLNIPYQAALLIVMTVLPIFTFIASKMWVFD